MKKIVSFMLVFSLLLVEQANTANEYFEEDDEIIEVENLNYDFYFTMCEDSSNKSDSTICRRILSNITGHELKCTILLDCKACQLDTGFLQYLDFLLCKFPDKTAPTILLSLWLLVLLMCFATIADEFFSPCLIALARTLRMNQNLAGVTLLAFGNGAPDVFSAITAITSGGPDNPDEGLGLGFLLGSGFLVNTIAAGGVIMIKPFKLFRRPFLKDTLFYMTAVAWSASILIRRKMTLGDSIGFLCLYTLYVFTTWAGGAIRKQSMTNEDSIFRKIFGSFEKNPPKAQGNNNESDTRTGSLALSNIATDNAQNGDDSTENKFCFTNPVFEVTDYENDEAQRQNTNDERRNSTAIQQGRNRISQRRRTQSKISVVDHELPYLVRWIIAHEQDDVESTINEKLSVPKTQKPNNARIDRTSSVNVPNMQKLQFSDRRYSDNSPRTQANEIYLTPHESEKKLSIDSSIPEETPYQLKTDIQEIIDEKYVPKVYKSPSIEPSKIGSIINPNKAINGVEEEIENFDAIQDEKLTFIEKIEEWACQNMWNHFLFCIIPVDLSNWPTKGIINKIFSIIRSPLIFIFRLTVPVVLEELVENENLEIINENEVEIQTETDHKNKDSEFVICTAHVLDEEAMHGWCKILNCIHCITCPMIWTLLISQGQGQSFGLRYVGDSSMHVVTVAFIVGTFVACVVFLTSRWYKPPSLYHRPLYALMGFVTSIIWIYALANEFVNALESLGIVWEISEAILGLIVMAMASSIGDIMSNILLARNGYPRIAYSACLGSPIFNLLFGAGLPYTIKIVSGHDREAIFSFTLTQAVLFAVLLFVLLMNVVVAVSSGWTFPRWYSIVLFVLYVSFIIFALLVEMDIIVAPVSWNLITGVET